MMDFSKIIIFALDDDFETLEIIGKYFDEAKIENYYLFDNVDEFFQNLHKDVRIVIIDHYINGDPSGPEIMRRVFESDKRLGKLIPTKVIIMSGQKRPDLFMSYSIQGAEYLDKNEDHFYELLVHFVKKNLEDIAFKMDLYKRQLDRMQQIEALLTPPKSMDGNP